MLNLKRNSLLLLMTCSLFACGENNLSNRGDAGDKFKASASASKANSTKQNIDIWGVEDDLADTSFPVEGFDSGLYPEEEDHGVNTDGFIYTDDGVSVEYNAPATEIIDSEEEPDCYVKVASVASARGGYFLGKHLERMCTVARSLDNAVMRTSLFGRYVFELGGYARAYRKIAMTGQEAQCQEFESRSSVSDKIDKRKGLPLSAGDRSKIEEFKRVYDQFLSAGGC